MTSLTTIIHQHHQDQLKRVEISTLTNTLEHHHSKDVSTTILNIIGTTHKPPPPHKPRGKSSSSSYKSSGSKHPTKPSSTKTTSSKPSKTPPDQPLPKRPKITHTTPGFSDRATSSQTSTEVQTTITTTHQCTTSTTTTTSVQRDTSHYLPAPGGETIPVSHHIRHVHGRRAIRSFVHEQARRNATNENRDKKHRHKIVNHTNNNLMVNLTNHGIEPPLQSMLSKGLKFVPTPDKTCLKTIVNLFKQFRRSMYIHLHFRNSSKDHPNPFKTTST